MIPLVPAQRGFDDNVVFGVFAGDADGRVLQGRFRFVEEFDISLKAAFVMQCLLDFRAAAFIGDVDAYAGIEEGKLAQPVFQRVIAEAGLFENFGGRMKRNLCAGLFFRNAFVDGFERRLRNAVLEAHKMFLAVAPDG